MSGTYFGVRMHHIVWFVVLLLQYPCRSHPYNTDANLKENNNFPEEPSSELKTKDFTLAKGNQSCSQLVKQIQSYLEPLPTLPGLYVRPAIGLGLIKVGCLSDTDPYYKNLMEDEHVRDMYRLLSEQWRTSAHLTSPYLSQRHKLDSAVLRFNLNSLSPVPLFRNVTRCSGFQQVIKDVTLKGFESGKHLSLHEAAIQCDKLGPSCAGVTLDNSGTFHAVTRKGSFILPQMRSSLWLHRCYSAHVKRRSATSECKNEQEERVYNVMQWVPVVSGWYSAGSAVYYASKGCGTEAESRAIEASIDLGSDALLAITGGYSGFGLAVKPVLKVSVKAAIEYFKQEPPSDQFNITSFV